MAALKAKLHSDQAFPGIRRWEKGEDGTSTRQGPGAGLWNVQKELRSQGGGTLPRR